MNFSRISFEDIKNAELKIEYLHAGADIGSGAFDISKKAQLRILLPRYVGVVSLCAQIFTEDMTYVTSLYAEAEDTDHITDSYLINIDKKLLGVGLYFYRLFIECAAGEAYAYKQGRRVALSRDACGECFQMSLVDFGDAPLSPYRGGIIYHVFVDRFRKCGNIPPRADAVMIGDWDNAIPEYPAYPGAHLENNTFFGGNLYGVIEKLDHIASLGANLIYLSPVFEAYSNHKYDTADYMKVDAMFGGDAALGELIAEAKKRGIGIILDGVFNHTGSDSVYFNKNGRYKTVGAYQSKESPFYPWYTFRDHPDKYTCWWNIEILPRINPEVPECGEFIAGAGGVIEKWAKMGIAGFRLDVADELSDDFLSKIKSRLNSVNKENILYGEVWEDASNKIAYGKRKKYYLGRELDAVMNYPIRTGIISFLRDGDISELDYALCEVTFNAPKRVRDMQMNLLGTHDTERILTILGGGRSEGRSNAELSVAKLSREERALGIKRLKMAYTILATLPGIPAIFYADEAGLEGYKDPFNRRPYPWSNIDREILDFYREIGAVRRATDVFSDGDFRLIKLEPELLVFARKKASSAYLTVVNNSPEMLGLDFEKSILPMPSGKRTKRAEIAPYTAKIIKTTTSNLFEVDR